MCLVDILNDIIGFFSGFLHTMDLSGTSGPLTAKAKGEVDR